MDTIEREVNFLHCSNVTQSPTTLQISSVTKEAQILQSTLDTTDTMDIIGIHFKENYFQN